VRAEAFSRYRPLIDDWPAFLDSLERPLPACAWANVRRIDAERLAELVAEDGVALEPIRWRPNAFRWPLDARPSRNWPLLAGLFQIQEEVSMLPVRILDPRPGERILDLCACPGNKTGEIAVALEGRGTVVANDVSWARSRALRNTIERLGLVNVATTVFDGRRYPAAAGLFDRVLVDAPCSCEGTVRKNRGVIDELLERSEASPVETQKALLLRAFRLTKPGGRIVYSTCTFAPEENEFVVMSLIERVGDLVEVIPAHVPGLVHSPGLTSWLGKALDPRMALAMRVWPHQNDTGGFFVTALEKRAQERQPRLRDPAGTESRFHRGWGGADEQRVELEHAVETLVSWFGLPRRALEGMRFFQASKRGYYAASHDLEPPSLPTPDAAGILLLRTQGGRLRPTASVANVLGDLATRQTIEIGAADRLRFFQRERFRVEPDRVSEPPTRGPVIVRHQGFACGIGFCRHLDDGLGLEIESLFPRGWDWGLAPPRS
jgi:NOL1/NOP2/sun family putative RNA methylase